MLFAILWRGGETKDSTVLIIFKAVYITLYITLYMHRAVPTRIVLYKYIMPTCVDRHVWKYSDTAFVHTMKFWKWVQCAQ